MSAEDTTTAFLIFRRQTQYRYNSPFLHLRHPIRPLPALSLGGESELARYGIDFYLSSCYDGHAQVERYVDTSFPQKRSGKTTNL